MVGTASAAWKLPEGDWPESDLEHLQSCPACGASARALRFSGLRDKAFGAAEGCWSMFDCEGCGAAYLNPRPNPPSINRAYKRYFTHEALHDNSHRYFWRQSNIKARLKTGYLNVKYGYGFAQGLSIGATLVAIKPQLRGQIDYLIRHLPCPEPDRSKLLDVGCGNGEFLALAQALGFDAIGLEPDQQAARVARAGGHDVRQGLLPDPDFEETGFAHLTFNHVLEHLHDPRGALLQCLRLLLPGGRIWLSQPNLGSIGLKKFGANWRGLEAPRHLSLYDFQSISQLLMSVGFERVELLRAEEAAGFYYRQSVAMASNGDPYDDENAVGWTKELQGEADSADRAARSSPELAESLTVVAWRPAVA